MTPLLESYVAGTMPEAEATLFEERLFADPAEAAAASQLLAMRAGLKALAAEGPLVPVIARAGLEPLGRTFRIGVHSPIEGVIAVHIGDTDYVVARIPVQLADARRIDVRFCTPEGTPFFVAREVPFETDEVVVVCRSHVAITSGKLRVQVLDQDARLRAEVSIENLPTGT